MLELDFSKVNRAGVKNQATDAMSRLPTEKKDEIKLEDKIPLLEITTNMTSPGETEQEQETLKNYEEWT